MLNGQQKKHKQNLFFLSFSSPRGHCQPALDQLALCFAQTTDAEKKRPTQADNGAPLVITILLIHSFLFATESQKRCFLWRQAMSKTVLFDLVFLTPRQKVTFGQSDLAIKTMIF